MHKVATSIGMLLALGCAVEPLEPEHEACLDGLCVEAECPGLREYYVAHCGVGGEATPGQCEFFAGELQDCWDVCGVEAVPSPEPEANPVPCGPEHGPFDWPPE